MKIQIAKLSLLSMTFTSCVVFAQDLSTETHTFKNEAQLYQSIVGLESNPLGHGKSIYREVPRQLEVSPSFLQTLNQLQRTLTDLYPKSLFRPHTLYTFEDGFAFYQAHGGQLEGDELLGAYVVKALGSQVKQAIPTALVKDNQNICMLSLKLDQTFIGSVLRRAVLIDKGENIHRMILKSQDLSSCVKEGILYYAEFANTVEKIPSQTVNILFMNPVGINSKTKKEMFNYQQVNASLRTSDQATLRNYVESLAH